MVAIRRESDSCHKAISTSTRIFAEKRADLIVACVNVLAEDAENSPD